MSKLPNTPNRTIAAGFVHVYICPECGKLHELCVNAIEVNIVDHELQGATVTFSSGHPGAGYEEMELIEFHCYLNDLERYYAA